MAGGESMWKLMGGQLALPVLLVLSILMIFWGSGDYVRTVQLNWELELPASEGCLYETDSGASFSGDGERYHVLAYADDSGLEETLTEEATPVSSAEVPVTEILDLLAVPADQRPDFSDCRGFTAAHPTDERNRLYLLVNSAGTRLYVVECFFLAEKPGRPWFSLAAAWRFRLFLISAVAAPGTDRLCCRKPFSAPGAGLIPPGPAQGANGIVTGMLLAADRAFDQLPRTGNVEGGGVHVCWFRLHRHMFFRLREKVGAEKGQSSTGGAAVYIHLNPVGDGGKKARQSQAPARLPEVHLPPALGATHRRVRIHLPHLRMLTSAGSPDNLPWHGACGAPPPRSPGPHGRSCRTTCPRSEGRTPPARPFAADPPPSPAAGTRP